MGSYLYSCPGVLSGVARLLDFGNTYDQYNRAPNANQADALGILWDWATVADDMWKGVTLYQIKYDSELRADVTAKDEAELASR